MIDFTDGQVVIDEAAKSAKAPEFNLVPNSTINGMKLISPRLDVRRKFGSVLKTGAFKYGNGRTGYYDTFNGVTVIYNDRLYAEQYQIYAGTVKVNRFKIFPGNVKEFTKCFPDTYQTIDGWISRDYALAIKEQDGIINCLYVGYEGYYD